VDKKIIIEVMNGPEDGRLITCEHAPISIGRDSDNAVSLPFDHLISRNHARILNPGNEFILCDLNSTNGTFVGSKRVKKNMSIKPRMLFRVGGTLLRIRTTSSANDSQSD
jgi:pSer/pThr/pTyr-binding forkhead associated (FHA) protein